MEPSAPLERFQGADAGMQLSRFLSVSILGLLLVLAFIVRVGGLSDFYPSPDELAVLHISGQESLGDVWNVWWRPV